MCFLIHWIVDHDSSFKASRFWQKENWRHVDVQNQFAKFAWLLCAMMCLVLHQKFVCHCCSPPNEVNQFQARSRAATTLQQSSCCNHSNEVSALLCDKHWCHGTSVLVHQLKTFSSSFVFLFQCGGVNEFHHHQSHFSGIELHIHDARKTMHCNKLFVHVLNIIFACCIEVCCSMQNVRSSFFSIALQSWSLFDQRWSWMTCHLWTMRSPVVSVHFCPMMWCDWFCGCLMTLCNHTDVLLQKTLTICQGVISNEEFSHFIYAFVLTTSTSQLNFNVKKNSLVDVIVNLGFKMAIAQILISDFMSVRRWGLCQGWCGKLLSKQRDSLSWIILWIKNDGLMSQTNALQKHDCDG